MKFKLLQQIVVMSRYAFVGIIIQACLSSLLLATNNGLAQRSVDNVHLGFRVEKADLVEIFSLIEEKTDFEFAYKIKDVRGKRSLSMEFENETLGNILRYISKSSDLTFRRVNNQIIAKKAEGVFSGVQEDILTLSSQEVDISGKITDETGEGLPGASVIEKGTTNGTTTDLDGNYRLNLPENAVLVVSFVGYKTTEILLNGRSTIDVQMELDAEQLEEIVVVGYGTTKKTDITGSVASISNTAISERPISNFTDVLQGNAAGVAVNSTSGAPGSDVQVRIRGLGSINSDINPLYVVDGLPFTGGLNSINAYDIESIEVLKDASATAIYGSRGANGVILITTKKGTANGLTIDYNGTYGVQSLRKKIDLLNATQFAELANEAQLSIGNPVAYSPSDIAALHNNGKGTDWQDEIYRKAIMQMHQISVRGGTEKAKYYMSGNYLDQNGIVKTSQFEKMTMRANLDVNINKKLSIGNTLSVSRHSSDGVSAGRTTRDNSGNSNVVWAALISNPTLKIKDENGNFNPHVPDPTIDNPVALLDGNVSKSKATELMGSFYLKYDLLDWLSVKSTLGFGLRSFSSGEYSKKFIIGSSDGRARRLASQNSNWVSTTQLDVNKTFGDHKLNAVLVAEAQEVSSEAFSVSTTGFVVDNLLFHDLSSASTVLTPENSASKWSLASYLARVNYIFNDKYLLTLSGRYDGASRLAAGNKWRLFPSGALSWRMSEESFMSSVEAIDDLKLRVSYGESGNQSVGVYSTLSKLSPDKAIIGAGEDLHIGFASSNFANKDLTWEISKQLDIGADMTFLDGRLGLVLDYFNRKTTGLFFNKPLPSVVGTNSLNATTNIGSVRNSGVELELDATILDVNGLKWDVAGNFTFVKSKVLSLAASDTLFTGFSGDTGVGGDSQILAVGGNIGVFRGWINDGLYGSDVALTINGQTPAPGDRKYVDVDNNGDINEDDKVPLGSAVPNKFWGLTNTLSYQGFSFSFFLQGSHGSKLSNVTRGVSLLSLDGKVNNHVDALNRYTSSNTNTNIPRAYGLKPQPVVSSDWLESGSYVRLKTITLGYQIPPSVLERMNVRSLRIYVTGTNLLTFSGYSGYDPDVAVSGQITQQGFDQGVYPHVKSFVLGLNLGF